MANRAPLTSLRSVLGRGLLKSDGFWIILTLGSMIGLGIGLNAFKRDFEVGPLATWVSGAASTCAVIVALRGHRKAEEQRSSDKTDRHRASAQQALLKIVEFSGSVHSARSELRRRTETKLARMGSGHEVVHSIPPLRTLISRGPTIFKEDEENLFVRLNKIDPLLDLKDAMKEYIALLEILQDHARLHDAQADLSADTIAHQGGVEAVFDQTDPRSIKAMRATSARLNTAMIVSDRLLTKTIDAIPPAIMILRGYMQGGYVRVNIQPLRDEASLPMRPPPTR